MALAISRCACGVRGTALSLCGSGGFTGPVLCNAPAPPSLERDIDGAKPAVGAIDLEADGPALVERASIRGQVRAVHEHVARIKFVCAASPIAASDAACAPAIPAGTAQDRARHRAPAPG
jgi:hypothetical protein